MSSWADWIAITDQFAADIFDNPEALEMIQPLIDKAGAMQLPKTKHVSVDKVWDPLHRILTGDRSRKGRFNSDAGKPPLKFVVLGCDFEMLTTTRSLSILAVEDVAEAAEAMDEIDAEWFRKKFFKIPDEQFYDLNEDMCNECWTLFRDLHKLFKRTAKREDAMMCTISF